MATQTYNDGSYDILKNSEGDKIKLNFLIKMLSELTEPDRINELISQMLENGTLNEFDIMALKDKGIYKDDRDLQQDQKDQTEVTRFGRDFSVDGKDEIDDIEL